MSSFERLSAYRPYGLAALRIITALLFIEHGTMKLFAFPAAQMAGPLPPLMLFAALLELIGGILILVGLLTRPVAFLLAGEMAVAYFMAHAPSSFFPPSTRATRDPVLLRLPLPVLLRSRRFCRR